MSALRTPGGNTESAAGTENLQEEELSEYSMDDDFEGADGVTSVRVSAEGKQRTSIDVLSMPATSIIATGRPSHPADVSPERMKRNATKKVRGAQASDPMSHWVFKLPDA